MKPPKKQIIMINLMSKIFLVGCLLSSSLWGFGQNFQGIEKKIDWNSSEIKLNFYDENTQPIDFVEGMSYEVNEEYKVPILKIIKRLDKYGELSHVEYFPVWEKALNFPTELIPALDKYISKSAVYKGISGPQAVFSVCPFRRNGGQVERMKFIKISFQVSNEIDAKSRNFKANSVLNQGDIYKIKLSNRGIYKLDYDFFKSKLGINPDGIDPRNIKIYGNGGGLLSENNAHPYIDDLAENNIYVKGEEDGKFDQGDYVLFYSDGPNLILPNPSERKLFYAKHVYSDELAYFIKLDDQRGQRIQTMPSAANPELVVEDYQDYFHFEEDKVNLISTTVLNPGGGKLWFGDQFKGIREKTYSEYFNVPNIDLSQQGSVSFAFASRNENLNVSHLDVENGRFTNQHFSITLSDLEGHFASYRVATGDFTPLSENLKVKLSYPEQGQNSEGWLDYIGINVHRKLIWQGTPLHVINFASADSIVLGYRLKVKSGSPNSLDIWDITEPLLIMNIEPNVGSEELDWASDSRIIKRYIVLDPSGNFSVPTVDGKVPNQNLHGMESQNMIILYHPYFKGQAERLAAFKNEIGVKTKTLSIQEVYNEFSSGIQDITAFRNLNKMMHFRYPEYKFMLLFGDGSYDYKGINTKVSNQNFVPTYETWESLFQLSVFPTDDYFGLLDEDEAGLNGALDIAIGRLPARSEAEAKNLVDKIIQYESDPIALGDWRTKALFLADDGDNSLHTTQCNRIADNTRSAQNNLNYNKIFFDAYKEENTPGGERFPTAKEAINNNVYKGLLVMTYFGHGGNLGLAQERVMEVSDIRSWKNGVKLPLFVTATCTFGAFDNAASTSPAEYVLHNTEGGGIALFTTVRPVFASDNEALNRQVFRTLLPAERGPRPQIGEILINAKNYSGASLENNRKFVLLGDPSLRLAIPLHNVVVTKFKGQAIDTSRLDTIKALGKVTFEGEVRTQNGQLLQNFNGTVLVTLYDKNQTYKTLGQGRDNPLIQFQLQNNVLFKGSVSVQNGKFTVEFYLPKDINYNFGNGRISMYAHDGVSQDGMGYFDGFVIGGTDTLSANVTAPKVSVFMNTEEFVFGGLTDKNPTILVKLQDELGINVAGNSIGHDLEGLLDNKNTYVLNEFYESLKDNYKEGYVKFPLNNISEGRHTLSIKAWNIANKQGEGKTEFVVANSGSLDIKHLLNYPNPFFNHTEFRFEHNQPNILMSYAIQIFNLSGKIVKTIQGQTNTEGYNVTDIHWDGKDDFEDKIANGVYLYKLRLSGISADGKTIQHESDFEKLVILN